MGLFDNITSFAFNTMYTCVKIYNYCTINVYTYCNYFYNNNSYVKYMVNGTNKCCHNIRCIMSSNKLEHFDSWYGIIYRDNNIYRENVFFKEESDEFYNNFIKSNTIKNSNYSIDTLFMIKTDDKWISKLLLQDDLLINSNVEKVKKSFLSVEYHHPKIGEPIELEINENFYLNENEILSSVFVLRMLEYQSKPFLFDNDYTLKIMDNNVNMFDLKHNDFIYLKQGGYSIKNYE